MATDPLEAEFSDVLKKLSVIQTAVGGKGSKTSNVGADGKVDNFLDLQDALTDKIATIYRILDEIAHDQGGGSKSRDTIINQQEIRRLLTACNEDWNRLNNMYLHEAKKRKSKLSKEDMLSRQKVIVDIQHKIEEIKDRQRAGYTGGTYRPARNLVTLEESEIMASNNSTLLGSDEGESKRPSGNKPKGVTGSRNVEMTDSHRHGLQVIRERDLQIDNDIEQIGEGVTQLHYLALAQNEEVKLQNLMLSTMETKIESVHDSIVNVNGKLKETLEKARSGDKICVDIFCLLILIGMIVVLYQLTKTEKK